MTAPMDRRTFLHAGAALPALAIGPEWLRRAFRQDAEDEDPLAVAEERAERLGKPVLVFVIPKRDRGKHERGLAFGLLLTYASAELTLALPLCEVVCATMKDVRKRHPHWKIPGEPLAVLMGAGGDAAPFTVVDPTLEPFREPVTSPELEAVRAQLRSWIAPLDRALVTAICADEKALATRAAAVRAAQEDVDARLNALLAAPRDAETEEVLALAAPLRERGLDTPRELLREAVRVHLLESPPRGTHWASTQGCSDVIEGVERSVYILCGMGHVPEGSRRFLWFFTIESAK